MNRHHELALRERTTHLPLVYWEAAKGEFTGNTLEDYAEMIRAAHIVADESRLSLSHWIDAGRRAGMSWAEIGGLIGVSKQAAQQRFGGSVDPPQIAEPGTISVRLGATAFNEMAMLRAEGERGRELIGTGVLALTFRQSDTQWAYTRVSGVTTNADAMATDGWRYVSSWFIFHYFKRPIE